MSFRISLAAAVATCLLSNAGLAQQGFGPGQRVLLDAHNAYPQNDRWSDRIDRALSTGLPVAIEQDLYWAKNRTSGRFEIVVAHDTSELDRAPTLEAYFFEKIRPIMERALAEQQPRHVAADRAQPRLQAERRTAPRRRLHVAWEV